MAFLRNAGINRLNVHYAVHSLAFGAGGVFFGAFLLDAGISAAGVLLALTAVLAGRFVVRPLVLPLAIRFGLRRLVVAGAALIAVQYPILARVQGVDGMLVALCIVSAVGDAIYWTCYHAYFASIGDDEHRGHQISIREAAAAVIGIVAPLLGGWGLATIGARAAFGAIALVQLASVVPLLGAPDVAVAPRVDGALRKSLRGVAIFSADGWISGGFFMVWQVALFGTLAKSFTAFGGAMALAALVGAVGTMVLGRAIDGGAGRRAVPVAVGAMAVAVSLRAVAVGQPALAVIANALGSVAGLLYAPTLMTAIYVLAKRSPCTLRFHVATEGAFDVGAGSSMLAAAAVLALGGTMTLALLIPLAGAPMVFVLLRRYYADGREGL